MLTKTDKFIIEYTKPGESLFNYIENILQEEFHKGYNEGYNVCEDYY